jgi:hypothetical protein
MTTFLTVYFSIGLSLSLWILFRDVVVKDKKYWKLVSECQREFDLDIEYIEKAIKIVTLFFALFLWPILLLNGSFNPRSNSK